jgi:eukaryotic-like serine/threonine-protein kinase
MSVPIQREVVVLNGALERSGAERVAYLDGACDGDPQLRERVEALLRAHDQAESFLEAPAAGQSSPPAQVPRTERLGEKIGRYKLLQQIGEGGCGVVYMAEQEEPVRRRVAFKVIKLGMDTKQVIARFEAERQALAMMDHPNIAKVLDAGATDTGRPYFVMELVRGIRITDFCDDNKLSTEERLKLFIQVCQAIQHAHQKGVIHRDIKPSNILVTINDPGSPGVPKVIDFGIAKATQGRLTDQTLFTAFEQFIGTPAYMSPEQAVMTSLDIDTRSDIYSLGVLLYQLLTGCTPFDQKELLASGLDEMRRTIREKEPPRPSTRLHTMAAQALTTTALHRQTEAPKLIHRVRGDLDWIVMKCLEKDRSRRYETANGLAMDLQRHLKNEPVVARPPSRLYRFQKSVYRNKTVYVVAAALVAVLVLGVVMSTSQAIRARRAEHEQARLLRVAETKERKSEQVAQFLKDMLKGLEPKVARGRDASVLKEVLDKTAGRVGKDLDDLPEVEAELRGTIGDVYYYLGEYKQAEGMYRRALALRREPVGPADLATAQLLNNLGLALVREDRIAEAETVYRKALAIRRQLLGQKHRLVAESLVNLAFVMRRQGKLNEAETLNREALAMRQELLGTEHLEVAESLQGLGEVLQRQGKLEAAEAALRQALAMQTKLLGPEDLVVADTGQDLGNVLRDQGRYLDSEKTLQAAWEIERKLQGEEHLETTTALVMLLRTLLAEEKYAQAEPLARSCLAIREKQMPNDPRVFYVRTLVGACLLGQNRYQEAEPLLLSGYEGIQQRAGLIHWEGRYIVTDALARLVKFYEVTGKADLATEWKQRLETAEAAARNDPAGAAK